jgi:hypothetical protein
MSDIGHIPLASQEGTNDSVEAHLINTSMLS